MHLRSFGQSDVGRRRTHNEDSFLIDDELGLYVVADGVGGQAKGEVASAEAVEEVHGFVRRERHVLDKLLAGRNPEGTAMARRLVESAIQSACYMIYGLAEMDPNHRGMSTTMTVLLARDSLGIVGQVGDSRVYRLRQNSADQLTEDHTLLNYRLKHGLIDPDEIEQQAGKNVITRAVGHRDYVQVDTLQIDIETGDRYLLCSDGLHQYLQVEEMHSLLTGPSMETIGVSLIGLANERGGRDNITVLLVEAE